MQKRRLGRTGQMSAIVAFGGAAVSKVSQEDADASISLALDNGVNHFDVAPSYGEAELRLAPWMKKRRDEVYLACKTEKRTRAEASHEMLRSLERLGIRHFDLYQLHALDDMADLEVALGAGGAMEAILEARDAGLVRHVGITGHRSATQVEALKRFDFDTVMFPLNPVLRRHRMIENDYEPLMRLADDKGAGMIAIKSVAKQRWQTEERVYRTWYEPFDEQGSIDRSLWFALSQPITSAVMPGDVHLIPKVLDAARRFVKLSEAEQERLLMSEESLKPLWPE
jgi:aryl-alcohol dehydrogenase-like predicted oxidoreductase